MTSKKGNQATTKGNKGTAQPAKKQNPPYATRYVAVDSISPSVTAPPTPYTGLRENVPLGGSCPRTLPIPATNSTPKAMMSSPSSR